MYILEIRIYIDCLSVQYYLISLYILFCFNRPHEVQQPKVFDSALAYAFSSFWCSARDSRMFVLMYTCSKKVKYV